MILKKIILLCIFFIVTAASAQNKRDSLINKIKLAKTDTERIDLQIKLASHLRGSNPDTCFIIVNSILNESKQINYVNGEAKAYHVKGMLLNIQAKYDSAITCFYRSILLHKKINDKRSIGASYFNIGLVHYNRGDFDKALQYYLLSSKIDQELGDELGNATTLNNIALIYWTQSQLDKAKQYFETALKTYIKYNDYKGIGGTQVNLGGIWYYKHDFKKAKDCFLLGLKNYQAANDARGINSCYNNLGEISLEEKKYEEAINYQIKAYEAQVKFKDPLGQMFSLMAIAKIYVQTKNTKEAVAYAARAIKIGEEKSAKRQLVEAYKIISEAYLNTEKFEPAYFALLKYTNLKDSLYGQEASEKLAEAETKYESEKSKKEVALLTADKKLKNEQLSKQTMLSRIFSIGGIIILVMLGFAIYAYIQKRKANLELEVKNREINLKNEELNQQNEEISAQRDEIEKQKSLVEEKNTEVTDSIKYAKRLQDAILPDPDFMRSLLKEHFILFKPKDIVSGDFYWADSVGDKTYFAAVDCTGHGVPGAFLSVVAFNLLKHAIHEHKKVSPDEILNQVNWDLSETLKQSRDDSTVKDGMDISLCSYDRANNVLEYAGANNSIYILSPNTTEPGPMDFDFKEYKADKRPIGIFMNEELKPFKNNIINVNKGDRIYLSTDGYADQFGGINNKKFKYKQLEDLLLTIAYQDMKAQKEILNNVIENWMSHHEQIDDVCIIGIKI